jgi:hypothetical protein
VIAPPYAAICALRRDELADDLLVSTVDMFPRYMGRYAGGLQLAIDTSNFLGRYETMVALDTDEDFTPLWQASARTWQRALANHELGLSMAQLYQRRRARDLTGHSGHRALGSFYSRCPACRAELEAEVGSTR